MNVLHHIFYTESIPVQKILKKYGHETIKEISILKTKLKYFKFICDLFFEKCHKDIVPFHLALKIITHQGNVFLLEKNVEVTLRRYDSFWKNADTVIGTEETPIHIDMIPKNLSVNQLLLNTKQQLGNDYIYFSIIKNNCQVFVNAVLESNKINYVVEEISSSSSSSSSYILQDLQLYFSKSSVPILFIFNQMVTLLFIFIRLLYFVWYLILPCVYSSFCWMLDGVIFFRIVKRFSSYFQNSYGICI